MIETYTRKAVDEINRKTVTTDNYVQTDFGIKKTDKNAANLMSSTFGIIKNNLQALWYSVGLDPNVNVAYQTTMTDPNQCIEVRGKKFYPHPGVGKLQTLNEMGNSKDGCFTMCTMA